MKRACSQATLSRSDKGSQSGGIQGALIPGGRLWHSVSGLSNTIPLDHNRADPSLICEPDSLTRVRHTHTTPSSRAGLISDSTRSSGSDSCQRKMGGLPARGDVFSDDDDGDERGKKNTNADKVVFTAWNISRDRLQGFSPAI